jgi:spermidine synthase
MEGGGARNVSAAAAQTKGSGDDGSCKPLPPCCIKAKAGVPESEAKCHATVVSGWFTESHSRSGTYVQIGPVFLHLWELQGHTKSSVVSISETKLLHVQVKQAKCGTSTIQCGQVLP